MTWPLSREDRWALAGLAVLPFAWFFTPIFTNASYYLGDLMAQYNPWWSYGHEILREGRLPLWNPFSFGGMPYHVNPENSLFYPLKFPLIFFSFFRAAALLRALNSIVASTGMYVLLRSYGLRRLSAATGALMFTYGSFMSYEFVHIPYVNTAVWFPWQLLALNHLVRRPRLVTSIGLAFAVSVSFLGGSPGIFLIGQMTLGFFLLFSIIPLIAARRWSHVARVTAALGLAVVLVIGLTAVLLVPTYEFIQFSPRAEGLGNDMKFTDFALIPQALVTLVFPLAHVIFGAPYPPIYPIYFLNVPYLGVAAVLLALLAMASKRYTHIMPAVLAASTCGVFLAMGTRTAFFPWFLRHVTVLDWFRWPHDYLLMAYLGLSVAAPMGLDSLLRVSYRELRLPSIIAALYLAAAWLWLPTRFAVPVLVAGTLVLFSLGFLLRSRPRWLRTKTLSHVAGTVLLLFIGTDLFFYSWNHRIYMDRAALEMAHHRDGLDFIQRNAGHARVAFSSPGSDTFFRGQERVLHRHIPLVTEIPARNRRLTDFDRWLRRTDSDGWTHRLTERRAMFHGLRDSFWDYPVNLSMIFHYQEISGYNPFVIDRVTKLHRTLTFERTWNLFNVKYIVTPNRVLHEQLKPVFSGKILEVYENRAAFPRVMTPCLIRGGLNKEEVLEAMRDPGFDPMEVVLLEDSVTRQDGETTLAVHPATPSAAKISDYGPEHVTVEATMSEPGFLVLHDIYYPGWKAYVDGVTRKVWRANFVFRAVRLPAGPHTVEFRYQPKSFYGAAVTSLLCWLLCAGVVTRSLRRPPGEE